MSEKVISQKNQIRGILFIAVLMVITVAVILKEYSIREIAGALKIVNPFYLAAGIGMMFIYAGCQAMNFYLIMRKLGRPAAYKNCIEYAYIGNYFGAITPGASGGQPAQMYYMNKDRVHIDLSAITLFFMVFISQIVIVIMGGVLIYLRRGMVFQLARWFLYLLLAGALAMLGLTIILTVLIFTKKTVPLILNLLIKLGHRLHLIKKPELMKAKADLLITSYRYKSKVLLKHPDLFIEVFLITALQWISFCMVTYLVYLSFGYRDFDALDLLTGQSVINIAVAAVPLPGSVGVAEKAFLNVYGKFYPANDLPSAMILSRLINFYLPLLISFLVYLMAHRRIMKDNHK